MINPLLLSQGVIGANLPNIAQYGLDANASNQEDAYYSILRKMALMPEPTLPEPAGMSFDPKQMLIGSVLAGLVGGGEGANSFLQGTLQGKMAQKQQQDARNQEIWRRQKMEQDRQLGILKTEAEIANQKADRAFQKSEKFSRDTAAYKKALEDAAQAEADRKSREKIAAGKAESARVTAARKVLSDPKSTKAGRQGALLDLADEGYTYPPDLQKQYLESTYYEDNQKKEVAIKGQNADTAAKNADTAAKRLVIFGKESDARIARMTVQSAQEVRRADALIQNANTNLKNVDDLIKNRSLNRDVANLRNANTALGSTLSALSTQANTIRMRQTQREKALSEAANDEDRKKIIEDLNGLSDALGAVKKLFNDARLRREALEKQLMSSGSGVNNRHQQALNAIAAGAPREAVIKAYEAKGEKWPGG